MKHWLYFAAVLFLTGCSKPTAEFKTVNGEIWNTCYKVIYQSERELTDSILYVFRQVDGSVSVFNDSSTLSRINRNETIEVDSLFSRLFELSKYVYVKTDGAFDPTVEPLIEIYGFGRNQEYCEPTKHQIDSLMQFVGLGDCSISDGRVHKKSPFTSFNFSAIAKGYGIDLIGNMLRRNGVENYLIEIGGDIAVKGRNQNGESWSIYLESTGRIIRLTDGAVATSGNYRKNNGKNGHIIDPRTGLCSEVTAGSVSVVAPSCALADAFATACMITDIDTLENVKIYRENE